MEKEFLPYKQALAVKELGFDRNCFGWYEHECSALSIGESWRSGKNSIVAPLYQQIFRWFREKYKLQCYPILDTENIYWCLFSGEIGSGFLMKDGEYGYYSEEHLEFKTYEEAELECLKKLIEVVKGEKHAGSSKVKTLANVDVEKLESVRDFIDYAVTQGRFNQALEDTFPNEEPINVKKMGDLIRWVVNDIIKEESDTLAENGLEPKDVNSQISGRVRDMFFKLTV